MLNHLAPMFKNRSARRCLKPLDGMGPHATPTIEVLFFISTRACSKISRQRVSGFPPERTFSHFDAPKSMSNHPNKEVKSRA
jgi:hypothetical protein